MFLMEYYAAIKNDAYKDLVKKWKMLWFDIWNAMMCIAYTDMYTV